jgi:hypothetical protein
LYLIVFPQSATDPDYLSRINKSLISKPLSYRVEAPGPRRSCRYHSALGLLMQINWQFEGVRKQINTNSTSRRDVEADFYVSMEVKSLFEQ